MTTVPGADAQQRPELMKNVPHLESASLERGVALVEVVILLGFLLLLAGGVAATGHGYWEKQLLTGAVRNGVRLTVEGAVSSMQCRTSSPSLPSECGTVLARTSAPQSVEELTRRNVCQYISGSGLRPVDWVVQADVSGATALDAQGQVTVRSVSVRVSRAKQSCVLFCRYGAPLVSPHASVAFVLTQPCT
jgi:hypothetical protein